MQKKKKKQYVKLGTSLKISASFKFKMQYTFYILHLDPLHTITMKHHQSFTY